MNPRPAPVLYLFDIDGTIMLSGGAGSAALNQVFLARYGLAGAMDGVRPGGKTDPLIVGEMFANKLGRAPTTAESEAILSDYLPALRARLQQSERFRMMPAVIATLDYLAQRPEVHLTIATGNIRAGAEAKLARAGLLERFAHGDPGDGMDGGFGDDSAERSQLVARAIERAEARFGQIFTRDRMVVVGDTPRDVSAARACGIRVLAVATGSYSRVQLQATEPDALFDTLAELPDWHETHLATRPLASR